MSLKNFQKMLLVLMLLISACGSLSSITDTTTDESSTPDASLNGVHTIDFNSNNEATINFSDVNGSDTYVVALFSSNEDDNRFSYSLNSHASGSHQARHAATIENNDESNNEDFDAQLRELESNLDTRARIDNNNKHAARQTARKPRVGSTRTFKVLNSFDGSGEYDTVSAQLIAITDHFYAYYDTRNLEDKNDSEISDLLENFDDIIEKEHEIFGEESDINNDDHFAILFTQTVNEIAGVGGGFISGFFYGADLYSSDSYPSSNEMEIIYCMIPDPSGDYGVNLSESFSFSNILPEVLPHELQHMISYNQHVFVNEGSSETTWLNEALSHFAEDIYSDFSQVGLENPSRVEQYLAANDTTNFTGGANLAQRGGSYLFIRYLYEQANKGHLSGVNDGEELLGKLLDTSVTGIDNVTLAVLGTTGEDAFKSLLSSFSLAIYLSDTGMTTNNQYNFSGIDLHGDQNDNRGTVLEGPTTHNASEIPYAGSISSAGVSYVIMTGDDIINAGNKLSASLADDMKGGGYLMQLDAL